MGVGQQRFIGGIDQPADVLENGRGVLFGQGVVEGEGKRGPRGDGTWFLFWGDLCLVVFGWRGGGMAFTQLHLYGVEDTGAEMVVVAETSREGKGMAACKRAGCIGRGGARDDPGCLDFLLVLVRSGGILGRRGICVGNGTPDALL